METSYFQKWRIKQLSVGNLFSASMNEKMRVVLHILWTVLRDYFDTIIRLKYVYWPYSISVLPSGLSLRGIILQLNLSVYEYSTFATGKSKLTINPACIECHDVDAVLHRTSFFLVASLQMKLHISNARPCYYILLPWFALRITFLVWLIRLHWLYTIDWPMRTPWRLRFVCARVPKFSFKIANFFQN